MDKNDLLKKLGLQGGTLARKKQAPVPMPLNDMTSASYLRQSSALIHDALDSGLDVLQMANGDIVTTGTQIIVTRYVWDSAKGKLMKVKQSAQIQEARHVRKPAGGAAHKQKEPEDA